MIQSMTGFGRSEASNEMYNVVVEVKSVNNRFRDIRFKIPSIFSQYEIEMKKIITSTFRRGSFEIYISYKKTDKLGKLDDIDHGKVALFIKKMKDISDECDATMSYGPCDFIRPEFFNERGSEFASELYSLATKGLKDALANLQVSRETEGEKLTEIILSNCKHLQENLSIVEQRSEQYEAEVSDRLKKRFKEFSSELKVEESRFLQEIVYYLERLDVNEEIDRINTHLSKLDKVLNSNKEIGREIDFLVQELGRETNTIGSKSGNKEISEAVVQMKIHLEKIREQGLNLE